MNWFERHLNKTVLLSWLAQVVLMFIAVMAPFYMAEWSLVEPEYGMVNDTIVWVVLFITSAFTLFVEVWTLRKKDRSLWWLLVLHFVPFGYISFFNLRDESEQASQRQSW